jgi:hypothetical protein
MVVKVMVIEHLKWIEAFLFEAALLAAQGVFVLALEDVDDQRLVPLEVPTPRLFRHHLLGLAITARCFWVLHIRLLALHSIQVLMQAV